MPELPEVEHARKLVQKHLVGKVIRRLWADAKDDIVFENCAKTIKDALTGRRLTAACRKGKHLWLEVDQPPHAAFHLGMTGAFFIRGVERIRYVNTKGGLESKWPPNFLKLEMEMDDGTTAAFTDPRRFGRVRLFQTTDEVPSIAELGFDALNELPNEEQFQELLSARKRSVIKSLLLDQTFAAGIGNWVADEVLFHARIHPQRLIESLSVDEQNGLLSSIRNVLETAVKCDADSDKYPSDWLFGHRWSKSKKSETPVTSDGYKVEFKTVGGRTSAFVPELQKMMKASQSSGRAPSKKTASKQAKSKGKKEVDAQIEETTDGKVKEEMETEPKSETASKQTRKGIRKKDRDLQGNAKEEILPEPKSEPLEDSIQAIEEEEPRREGRRRSQRLVTKLSASDLDKFASKRSSSVMVGKAPEAGRESQPKKGRTNRSSRRK